VNSPWWSRPEPVADPAVRLLCFPHAGRGGSMFRSWPGLLPPSVEVCAVNPPGRESRFAEPLVPTMDELVGALLPALRPLLDAGPPVVLFGHSMGALVAFEVAARLAGAARGPAGLIVSGCPPPHRPPVGPRVSDLDDRAFLARLRLLGGTPPELLDNDAAMELLLPVLRSDHRLAEGYEQDVRAGRRRGVRCPITVLAGDADPETQSADLDAWAELTTAGCAVRSFAGGHFFLDSARPRAVAALTSALLPHLVA
jgi:surfactin synthase thioesterase subunit